jgi:hypothetical protein
MIDDSQSKYEISIERIENDYEMQHLEAVQDLLMKCLQEGELSEAGMEKLQNQRNYLLYQQKKLSPKETFQQYSSLMHQWSPCGGG